MKTRVLVPTYQELHTLASIVHRIFEHNPEVHVLVIDDNSPDGTGKLADQLKAKYSNLEVLHRKSKNGLGAAYIDGFNNSINDFDVLVEMDADGSHDPQDLVTILKEIDNYDIALLNHLANGVAIDDMVALFKKINITPNSKSAIEKRVAKLKDYFKASNNVHLIAIAKDLGVI